MSSEFESAVYIRERHTPWSRMSFLDFVGEMIYNGADSPMDNQVFLTCQYRKSVSSRIWFTLTWTGADNLRYEASAQTLQKALWRAAEIEIRTQERLKAEQAENKEKQETE